jgi:uncharacterized protein with NAD-binding domain and iron-sulfur cluster
MEMTTSRAPKQKIAILGGGISALTAAFELTHSKESADRYEITVYQVGHRLGGKGASGRNREHADRIEEHGLHILMGFYENTFRILRECYAELGRPAGAPLATVEDAFEPHSFITIAEEVQGKWEHWPLPFPPLPGKPGEGRVELPPPPVAIRQILSWMRTAMNSSKELRDFTPHFDKYLLEIDRRLAPPLKGPTRGDGELPPASDDELQRLVGLIDGIQKAEGRKGDMRGSGLTIPVFTFLELSYRLSRFSAAETSARLSWLLGRFRSWLSAEIMAKIGQSTLLRRLFITFDLGITVVLGMITDGVLKPPYEFFALDDLDLQGWLEKHGAAKVTRDSALIRSVYNLVFSGPGEAAAGTAIHGIMRMLFTYRGAIFYKMQAGMGDTIFAPLYLVLKQRGVKFEFFHRVENIALSPDKRGVAAVELGVQATPKNGEYQPLYDVDGLPCWPSAPNYDELVEGESLRASGETLESFWTRWPDVGKKRIEAGRDFDQVILGISIGAFPFICRELIEESPRFRAMVESVKTTQTQAVQLWLGSSFEELGWKLGATVLDGFAAPFDTWADMTHLLKREKWAEGDKPVALAYLCGRLEDQGPVPPRTSADYPHAEAKRVKEHALFWLNTHAGGLWPRAVERGEFGFSALIDSNGRAGVARLEGQYSQATFCPSERYVLAVPGSSKHRLRADESGFERLVLTGDWILTSLSCGCVEAATMAGMQASRAISGYPEEIVGDLPPAKPARRSLNLLALSSVPSAEAAGTSDLPLYIARGGEIVIPQPLSMHGTTSYSFILPANQERLGALVERLLNVPAGGAAHYLPAGPFVMLVCADIAHGQGRDEPYHGMGWLPERDVAFWVPVLAGKRDGGVFSAARLVWFLAYTFVDNTAALVTGREVFGFPKAQAVVRFPKDADADGAFSVDTLVIKRFGPKSRAEIARLLTVEELKRESEATGGSTWSSLREGFQELGSRLVSSVFAGVEKAIMPAVAVAGKLVDGYRGQEIGLVFLKQFRDVRDPARACYQAVVEAPAVVDAWRSGGFLPPHRLTIEAADSHPIVEELGLGGATVESVLGMWLMYDFTVGRGVVIAGRG